MHKEILKHWKSAKACWRKKRWWQLWADSLGKRNECYKYTTFNLMMTLGSFHEEVSGDFYTYVIQTQKNSFPTSNIKNVHVSQYSVSDTVNSGRFWKSVQMEQWCSDHSLACAPISSVWQVQDCLDDQCVFAFLPGVCPAVFWPYVYHNVLWQEIPQFDSMLFKKTVPSHVWFEFMTYYHQLMSFSIFYWL